MTAGANFRPAITTKHGLVNSQKLIQALSNEGQKKQAESSYVLNDVKNLHYRGVRNPGLITYAGAGGTSHVLPP